MAEIICVLFNDYEIPEKDKLILSKGHGVPALYAAMACKGMLPEESLETFREIDSALQGHPDQVRLPAVTATTGSLGQGLSIACGHALAYKLQGLDHEVFCIVGDGEVQEGQFWEAMNFANKHHLDNLTCILDYNKFQSDGPVSDNMIYSNRIFESHGWTVYTVDGHDEDKLSHLLDLAHVPEMPKFIIADTVKGKGVSFMENSVEWHSKIPSVREFVDAMGELL